MRWKTMNRWIPLFFWVALIFVGSSIPRLSGEKFGMPRDADKVAHFIEYLVLAILFYRGAVGEQWRKTLPAWLIVVTVGLAIGMLDEFHQRFIPGRDSDIWDWTADAAGIASGTLIAMMRSKRADRGVKET